jgi:tRNA 2-thiouridine synthesizing protein C
MHDILVIIHSAPYGNNRAKEGLDYALTCSAYDQNIALLFSGDGKHCLNQQQSPITIKQKSFAKQLSALEMYGIDDIYTDAPYPKGCIASSPLTANELQLLLQNSRHVVNF